MSRLAATRSGARNECAPLYASRLTGGGGLHVATRELRCVVVTPERALVDVPADFVALPLYDGEVGILPGRAPLVGRLGYGELRIKRGNQTERYYVDGGFVQVRADVV